MPVRTVAKSHQHQSSDWSTSETVIAAQQQNFNRSNKVRPTENDPSSSINYTKIESNSRCKPLQWLSSMPPFLKGLLLSVLLGCIVLTIILPIWLTSAANKRTTITTTTVRTITLQWKTTGTTVAGIMNINGTAPNLLNWPAGIAIDSSNALYIGDYGCARVQKFFLGALNADTVAGQINGTQNRASNTLSMPAGVVVDSSSNIYVADSGNARIQFWRDGASSGSTVAGNGKVYTANDLGVLKIAYRKHPALEVSGTAGSSNNQLDTPYGIARDEISNTLYIADYRNHRIMAYKSGASSGVLVAGGNGPGFNNTQFNLPSGVYFDSPSNSLIIANRYAHNVVRWIIDDNKWTLIAGNTDGTAGNNATQLNTPFGVTLDPMGNVYVVDTINHRIQLFLAGQSSGTTIAGITALRGNDSNLLNAPFAALLDSQLNLYVADRGNQRIQKFLRY